MKETLQSHLNSYKNDNTESSKEDLLNTIDSLTSSVAENDSMTNSIEAAKKALTSKISNKGEIVQSVENVLSGLEQTIQIK